MATPAEVSLCAYFQHFFFAILVIPVTPCNVVRLLIVHGNILVVSGK